MDFDVEEQVASPVANSEERGRGTVYSADPVSARDEDSIDLYSEFMLESASKQGPAAFFETRPSSATDGNAPGEIIGVSTVRPLDEDSNLDLYTETLREELQEKHDSHMEVLERCEVAEARILEVEKELHTLRDETEKLRKEKTVIQNNMSSLLLTARTELKRKDDEIQRLRLTLSQSSDSSHYVEHPRSNASSPSRNKTAKIWTEGMKPSARQSRRTPPMLKVDEDSPRAKRKRSEDVNDSSPKRSRVRDSRSSPSDKKSAHRSTPERKSTPLKPHGNADKHGKSDSHRKGNDDVKSGHASGKSSEHRSRSPHTSGKSDSERKDCDKNYGVLDLREILRRKKMSKSNGCPTSERDSEEKGNRSIPGDKGRRKGVESHRSKKRRCSQERKDSLKKSVSVSPNKLPSSVVINAESCNSKEAGSGGESGIQTNLNDTESNCALVKQTQSSASRKEGTDTETGVPSEQNDISVPAMNENTSVDPAIAVKSDSELSCIGARSSSLTASSHLNTRQSSKPQIDAEHCAERASRSEECLSTVKPPLLEEDSVLNKLGPAGSVKCVTSSAVREISDATDSVTHITSSVREVSGTGDSIKCVTSSAVREISDATDSVARITSSVREVSGTGDSVKCVTSSAVREISDATDSVARITSSVREVSGSGDSIKCVTSSAVKELSGYVKCAASGVGDTLRTDSVQNVTDSAVGKVSGPADSVTQEMSGVADSINSVTSRAVKEVCVPMDSINRVTSRAVKDVCVPMDSMKRVTSIAVKEIRRIKPTMICGRQNLTLSEEKTCDVLDPVIQNIVTRETTSFANAKVVHIDTSPDDDSGDSNIGSVAETSRKDSVSTELKAVESTDTASVPATDGLSLCVTAASSTCGRDHTSSGFSQVIPNVKQHPDTSLTRHQGIPIKDSYPDNGPRRSSSHDSARKPSVLDNGSSRSSSHDSARKPSVLDNGPSRSSSHDSARKPSVLDNGSTSMPANDVSSEHSQSTTELRYLNTSRVSHQGVPIKNEDRSSDSSSRDSTRKQSAFDNDANLMHPNTSDDNSFDNDPKSMLPNASSNRLCDNDSKSMSAHASSSDKSLDNRNVHFCMEENEHLLVCTVNLHPDHNSMSMMSDTMMSELKSESFSSEISEADCPSELILKDEVCSRTIPYLYKSKKRLMHLRSPLKSSSIGGEVVSISPRKKKAKKRRKRVGAGCFSADEEQVSVTFDSDVHDADEEQNDFIPPRPSLLSMPIQEDIRLSTAKSLSETSRPSNNSSEILNDVGTYAFSMKEEQQEDVHAEGQMNDSDGVDGEASSSSSEVPRNVTADSSSARVPSSSHTLHVIDARLKGRDRPYNLQTFEFTSFPTHYASIPTDEAGSGGQREHSECSGSDTDDKQLNTSMETPVTDLRVNKLDVSEIKEPDVERTDVHYSDVEMEDASDRENVLVIAELDTESDTNSECITDQLLPFSGMTERVNPMDNVSNQPKPVVDMCPRSLSDLNISIPVRKSEFHERTTHNTETYNTDTNNTETNNTETNNTETKSTEASKIETNNTEASKIEASKIEASKIETHKTEASKIETNNTEASKIEASKIETNKTETNSTEASKIEANKTGSHEKGIHRTATRDILTHKEEALNAATIPKTKSHQTVTDERSSDDSLENVLANRSPVVSVVGHVPSDIVCALEEPAKPSSDLPPKKDRLLTLIKCKQRRTIGRQESLPARDHLSIEELSSSPLRKRSSSEPQRDFCPNVVLNLGQSRQCDSRLVVDLYQPVDLSLKAGSTGQSRSTVSPVLQTPPYLSGFTVSQDGALDLSRKANPSPSLQHGGGGLCSRSTEVQTNQTSDCVMKESKGLRRDIAKPSSSSFDNADSSIPLIHKHKPVFLSSSTDKETDVINSKSTVNRFKVDVGELKDMNSSSSFGFSPIINVVNSDGVSAGQVCEDNEVVPEEPVNVSISSMDKDNCSLDELSSSASSHEMEFESIHINPVSNSKAALCALHSQADTSDGVSKSLTSRPAEPSPMLSIATEPSAMLSIATEPSPMLSTATEPSPMLSIATEPSPMLSTATEPSPMLSIATEPSAMLSIATEPSPMLSIATEPSPMLSTATEPTNVLSSATDPRYVLSKAEEPRSVLSCATKPSPVLFNSTEPSPELSKTIETSGHTVNSCETSSNDSESSESSESESDDFSIELCVTDSECMDMDLQVQSSSKSIPGLLPEGNFEALRNDLNMSDDSKPETSDSNLLQIESGSNITSKSEMFKLPDMSTSAFAKLTSASQSTGVSERKSPEIAVKVSSLPFDEHSSLSLHADGCDFDHDFEDKSSQMGHGSSSTRPLTVQTVTEPVKDRKLCHNPDGSSKKMDDSIEDGEVTSDDADVQNDASLDLSELLKEKRLIEEKIKGIKEPLSSKNGRNGHRSERHRPERRHDHGAERRAKDHRPRDDHRTKSSSSDRERFSREIHAVDPRLGNRGTSASARHRYEKDEPRHGGHHAASTCRIPLDDRRDRHRASPTASVRASHWDHSKENHRRSTDRSDQYSIGTRRRDGPGPERIRRRRDSHSRDSGRRSGRDLRS